MEKKHNIVDTISGATCYGCGVCSSSCPKKIISIHQNLDGFYIPSITNPASCVNCGICLDVCSYIHDKLALEHSTNMSWAAWSIDENVRRKCSSGGIGFEIGKQLIEKGYKVIGCRYNVEKQRAEHYIATTKEELVQSIGSKYIQSYTIDAFKQINRKEKYLVVGTPCQIDSFRRYVKRFRCEDNFVLMDFFCHCVPSMLAWKAYTKMHEKEVGKITYASWRNKFEYGWHDSWLMSLDGEKTSEPVNWDDSYSMLIKERKGFIQSRWSQGDLFYKLFLGDVCFGPQCEKECKYKYDKSSADIRIGDLWGNTYSADEKGVSALATFTHRGVDVVNALKNITLIEHPFEVVAEGQMKKNVEKKEMYPLVIYMLRNGWSIEGLPFRIVMFTQRVISFIKRKR